MSGGLLSPALLSRLQSYSLKAQRSVLGNKQGEHRSSKKGSGIEFADYRAYQRGDNPRAIDWNLFARTDKLFIRRYQEEENLHMVCIVDGTPSMELSKSGASKAAAALLFLALRSHDSVTLSLPGQANSRVMQGARSQAHAEVALQKLVCDESDAAFLSRIERQLFQTKLPGIAVIISDLLLKEELIEKAYRIIEARHFEGAVLMVTPDEDPFEPLDGNVIEIVDSETGGSKFIERSRAVKATYDDAYAALIDKMKKLSSRYHVRFAAGHAIEDDALLELIAKSGVVAA